MPEYPETITLRRPDDWHVHLRDGAMLLYTARQFARAIVMPNLAPPSNVPTADDSKPARAALS